MTGPAGRRRATRAAGCALALALWVSGPAGAVEWKRPVPAVTAPRTPAPGERSADGPAPADAKPLYTPLRYAVLAAPLGPAVGVVGSAVGLKSVVVTVRGYRRVTERVAATLTVAYGQAHLLYAYRTLGVKFGPRLALSRPHGPLYDIAGWYVLPLGVFGWAWSRNPLGTSLASSPVLGAGVEAGYTWRWTHVVVEVGAGLAYTGLIGRGGPRPTETVGGLKPLFNASVGYGW